MAIKGGDPILEKQNWSPWFFGLCAFLFLAYGAAIYQEFVSRRTYITYQTRFREYEGARLAKEFEAFKTDEKNAAKLAEVEKLEADWEEKQKRLESDEYQKLQDEHYDQYIELGYVKAERSKAKSSQDAKFYDWKHALHTGDEEHAKEEEKTYWVMDVELLGAASAAPAEVESEVLGRKEDVLGRDGGFKSWEDVVAAEQKKLDEIAAQIAKIEEDVKAAEKAYTAANEPFQVYEERIAKAEDRSIRTIDQIVNNRLGIGGAYTFGTVDRCRSCHLATETGLDQEAFKAFDGELADYKHYDKLFSKHPKIDPLFTKHPVDTVGCTVCHDGQGRATRIKTGVFGEPDDFVFALEMDQPHGPAKSHGSHQWEWPLLKGEYVQANCQRCHAPQRWLDGAPVYEKGKDLFIEKGCHGCHAIKGYEELARVAPELTRIKSKVTGEWLVDWIQNPKAFYPDTRMPMYVFDEYQVGAPDPKDNVKVMAHPERQTDTAIKMAAYLWQNSAPAADLPFGKFPGGGNAENGHRIIQTVGCLGCHNDGEKGTGQAPPLYKAGGKMASADWIWNWVRNPRWHSATTTMPSLRLNDQEARDVTAWLWSQGQNARPKADAALIAKLEDPELAKEGNLLLAQWGCAGCHLIKGHEKDGRIGPELTLFGEKKPYELAFGDSPLDEHALDAWEQWTRGKIHNPRQYVDVRSAARMPWFGLSEQEIHALDVYLKGQRNLRTPSDMQKQFVGRNARIEKGRELVNRYNCVGCHIIEGRGGMILAFNKDRSLQPPNLNAEGLKIRSDYLVDFLESPSTIRPWLKIRMPTFPLSDQEIADIIAYFRAVDGIDTPFDNVDLTTNAKLVAQGRELFNSKLFQQCKSCHLYKGDTRATEATVAPELANVWRRFRPDGVEAWLRDPQTAMPGTAMPSFFYEKNSRTGELDPTYPYENPSKEGAEEAIDALREFLFSHGGGRQVSMAN